jgi:hypothetical protein
MPNQNLKNPQQIQEDLYDRAKVAERRDEGTISLAELKMQVTGTE